MEPGRERLRHARTICPAAEKCAAVRKECGSDLPHVLSADSCRFAVRASDGTCAAACIARKACVMCAAHLLPRNRCAARLNSRRRYAPMLPGGPLSVLTVCALSRCARAAASARLRLSPVAICHANSPAPAGIVPTCGPLLPPSALCARCACVVAVVQRGPLSRYYMWITRLLLYNILV